MSEESLPQGQTSRRISFADTEGFQREGFDGHVYVPDEAGLGFTMLTVDVHGSHPKKQMLGDTTRTYYVLAGEGSFTLDDNKHAVNQGDCFVITPGSTYEYTGRMQLLEINASPTNQFRDRKL